MDVRSGDFIWNIHKEKANVLKHGVDFIDAAQVFADPGARIVIDSRHSVDEGRYFCVGEVEGRVLTVRFTYRDGKIRIFGAGYWRKGKDLYEKKKDRS
jgi:uncharacterized protein